MLSFLHRLQVLESLLGIRGDQGWRANWGIEEGLGGLIVRHRGHLRAQRVSNEGVLLLANRVDTRVIVVETYLLGESVSLWSGGHLTDFTGQVPYLSRQSWHKWIGLGIVSFFFELLSELILRLFLSFAKSILEELLGSSLLESLLLEDVL